MFFLSFSSSAKAGFRGLGRVDGLSLCDPLSSVKEEPPWVLHDGVALASLLNGTLSPKAYLAGPGKHRSRSWMRFQEGH